MAGAAAASFLSLLLLIEISFQELSRPLFLRMLEDLFRTSVLSHRSLVEEQDLIGDVSGKLHLVGDDDHGRLLIRQTADYL